jgi:ABC-type multidrug transport system ATPase subunit
MIEIKNVSKSYGDVQAVSDVSFTVAENELFGVIGPDGAGKSTLFRMIISLLIPDSGDIRMWGIDPVSQYRQVREMVGYMPGRFSLYEDLSVEENLEFFASVFGTSIEENYDLIKDIYVQIEPFKKRKAGKLSGGMKQKLALSCALIHKPRFLVLDEPTTGVDAVSRKEFWEMLASLKDKGITILVSTPYMDEANMCDRVALMQNGQIMGLDTPEVLTGQFKEALFGIKSSNLYKCINDLREYQFTDRVYPFGEFLHYVDKRGMGGENSNYNDLQTIMVDIIEYLQNRGNEAVEVVEVKPDIEDRFIQLMGGKVERQK